MAPERSDDPVQQPSRGRIGDETDEVAGGGVQEIEGKRVALAARFVAVPADGLERQHRDDLPVLAGKAARVHEAAHFFRPEPGQFLVDVEDEAHLQPLGRLDRFEQARKLEQRRHARAVVIRPDRAKRRVVVGSDDDYPRLAGARAGASYLEVSNLHALRLEFLAGDGVAQARERRLDVTRGALERFGMPDVVFFACNGEDVRFQIRKQLLILDTERQERTVVPRAGHRGHKPDGEADEKRECCGDDEHEAAAQQRHGLEDGPSIRASS